MDAKSRVNYINSVANRQDNVDVQAAAEESSMSISKEKKQAFETIPIAATLEEEVSVFAQGLPSWDIIPPQVIVRRKKK